MSDAVLFEESVSLQGEIAHRLGDGEITIGRAPQNAISIPDGQMSKHPSETLKGVGVDATSGADHLLLGVFTGSVGHVTHHSTEAGRCQPSSIPVD